MKQQDSIIDTRLPMTEKIAIPLGDVQKTMFLPLWGRAVETRKDHPLLSDPTAVRIMESVDFDFSTIARNMKSITRHAWIARSLLIDRCVREYLENTPDATVVNIGCGMDTTFDRVDNRRVRWFDLDLPDVIALRRKFISETTRRTFIASSFLDSSWFSHVATTGRVMLVAAGVFYYYEEHDIRGFFIKLAERFPGADIVFDAASPRGVEASNRLVLRAGGMGDRTPLRWGMKNVAAIASWDPRIHVVAEHFYFREAGLRLSPGERIVGMIPDVLRIQWLVHCRFG
jgi:O-methyltransferase involved in polyketide biosynthesis